jgi:iron(III) transport system ATP-binding protein
MIKVTELVKDFEGGVRAVDHVSFEVPAGAFVTLLGPSGCGKTTTLRAVAGLERPTAGEIQIGDRVVFSSARRTHVPPNRRRIGMVFQSYAIWPHMTVFDNVAYPLKDTGRGKAEIQERTDRALSLVGLDGLANRPAPNLSGGQQQRVALARALVAEPEVLLLDEPLSNLDAKLRESMRQEVRDLQQRLGITTLYVTHDQEEALAISDLIAVMSQGQILEFDAPRTIYERPRTRFAAQFIGLANVLPVQGSAAAGDFGEGESVIGHVRFVGRNGMSAGADGAGVAVLFRPEDVAILRAPPLPDHNVWRGRVASAVFLGRYVDCVIEIGAFRLRAEVGRDEAPAPGEEVHVHVRPERCVALADAAPHNGVTLGHPAAADASSLAGAEAGVTG